MDEPSVLDYIKARLRFRKEATSPPPWDTPIPQEAPASIDDTPVLQDTELLTEPQTIGSEIEPLASPTPSPAQGQNAASIPTRTTWPWLAFAALLLALIAQINLEPANRHVEIGLVFYGLAAAAAVGAYLTHQLEPAALNDDNPQPPAVKVRWNIVYIIVPWVLISFMLFGGDLFTPLNLVVWVAMVGFFVWALWTPVSDRARKSVWPRIRAFLRHPSINVHLSGWTILLVATAAVIIFFRFYQLDRIPGEMFSDHAEKLLDVQDVLAGKTSIFFPRNTGREAIQFYLTAAIIKLLGTGVSFISLKIGTVLCGLLTLPFIYLLGKELGNRRVGYLALLLTGIGYWPNLIARIGLRFPLYPLFVAPALYYFFRALRTSNRNDYLLCGVALGLGLHGYSPARIVPIVLAILFGVYLLHPQAKGKRNESIIAFILLAVTAFIVFLPLFRYVLDNPEMFGYRALTRLGTTEQPYPAPVWQIFLSNTWKAVIMFFWDNGSIWVHSVVGRPALDIVTAGLYFLGLVLLAGRYVRSRRWQDIVLILAVPLLMMPSILSLAFPDENPSLNRTGGAIIPVFIIAAIAFEAIITSLWKRSRSWAGRSLVIVLVGVLLTGSAIQNSDLVFRQFKVQFLAGAWNTSEIGHVIRDFADSVGTPDTAYVVPYPYWVDTRLVGINAGYPEKDYALWPTDFNTTLEDPHPKLFILKSEDNQDILTLQGLFPDGKLEYHHSVPYEGKDFWLFYVPAKIDFKP